jgi:hypothetical protein
VIVHRFYPFLQVCPFRPSTVGILSFGFENEKFTVLQFDNKVRVVFTHSTSVDGFFKILTVGQLAISFFPAILKHDDS